MHEILHFEFVKQLVQPSRIDTGTKSAAMGFDFESSLLGGMYLGLKPTSK